MRKRILITGEKGFIGTNLKNRLSNENDIFLFGGRIQKPVRFMEVNEIFNLAGTPSPTKYTRDPEYVLETNTTGMFNILKIAGNCGAKVLHASTVEVLTPGNHMDTRACYRYGKLIAETICNEHAKIGIPVTILRMSNSYGPMMQPDDGRVIPVFIMKALRGEEIRVMGGQQTRSFCYVDDMINGMLLAMEKNPPLVHICSDERHNITEIAEIIVAACGSNSKINYMKDRPAGDSDQPNPTELTAQELLGWKPKIDFETGIRRTVEYFKTFF